jgi:hypothetical protein
LGSWPICDRTDMDPGLFCTSPQVSTSPAYRIEDLNRGTKTILCQVPCGRWATTSRAFNIQPIAHGGDGQGLSTDGPDWWSRQLLPPHNPPFSPLDWWIEDNPDNVAPGVPRSVGLSKGTTGTRGRGGRGRPFGSEMVLADGIAMGPDNNVQSEREAGSKIPRSENI